MSIRTLAARGLSFAHLAGINSRAARAEDDQRDDEDERAEDDDQEEQDRDDGDSNGSKGKKGKRAEDDRDDEDAEDDELEEDDSGKGKKGKKAADDEDDERAEDDDDEQMRGKSAVSRARIRERARCAAIMGHKAAGRNVALAASLAFNTSMSSQEAIAVLKATPGSSANADRPERSARNPQLGAGGEVHRNPQRESAAGWDRAFSKASGKRS